MRIDRDNITTLATIESLDRDLLLLENDLDALGWDQPARLYAVVGENGDYSMQLVSEMDGHPVDWLRLAVTSYGALPTSVAGVALAIEGWRHPLAQDIEQDNPEMWATLVQMAVECGFDPATDMDKIYEHTNNAFYKMWGHTPPSAHPMRKEIRSVIVLMRDGRGGSVNRTRGQEPEKPCPISDQGRIVEAMRATLTGIWPTDKDMNEPTPPRP